MKRQIGTRALLGSAMALTMWAAGGAAFAGGQTPLAIDSARITISGTSNIHAYTASTTTVRVTRAQVAGALEGPDFWANVLKPGGVEAFEIAIPAATLTSPKEGLDKNMHKALKVKEHPDIVVPSAPPRAALGSGRRTSWHRRAANRGRRAGGGPRHHDRAQGLDAESAGTRAVPDDRLRHQAADGDARDAEDRSEGDGHLRDGTGGSAHIRTASTIAHTASHEGA